MQKAIAILLLLSLLPIAAPAEDDMPFEALFAFFPDNVYSEFGFINVLAASKSDVYPVFEKIRSMSGDMMIGSLPPLPETFIDQIEYLASGTLKSADMDAKREELRKEIREAAEEIENNEQKNDREQKRLNAHQERAIEESAVRLNELRNKGRFYVAVIPGVQALIEEAVEAGTFAATGKRIGKRPIFNIRARTEDGADSKAQETFAYVADSGELLISRDIASLRDMVSCYKGNLPSLLDNQDYVAIFARVDRRHQGWTASPEHAAKKAMINQLVSKGATDERIVQLESEIEKGQVFSIQSMYLTEEIVMRSAKEYTTVEEAEQEHKKLTAQFDTVSDTMKEARKSVNNESDNMSAQEQRVARAAVGFAGNLLNSNHIEIQDNMVITDTIFGKKQLKTLTMLLNFAEKMEEQEREKEDAAEEGQQN